MPARLLELVVVGSVFAAAAAVVIGGFGVTPALVPAALFVTLFMIEICQGAHYPAEKTVLGVMWPFIAVVAGAIASSFIMPRLFEGEALVWPQKMSGFLALVPLAPNSGNYTQDMYLLVNASLAVTAAIYLTRDGFNLRRLLDGYFVAGLLAAFIAAWQFASNELHVWYPTDFFLSNPGWALLSTQTMGSLTRLNGPFSEPASLAAYLCSSVSAAAWVIFNGDKALLPRLTLVSGLAIILLCTSATGYLALAIMTGLLLVRTFLAAAPATRRRVVTGTFIAGVLVALAIATTPVVAPSVAEEAKIIFTSTTNKQQSASYTARTTSDRDSLRAMEASDFLGVGWGSNRSSSLGPGLCAAIGVWGIFGLLGFIAVLYRHLTIAHRVADASSRAVMQGCSAGLLAALTATMLSGPTISSPDFYLLLGLLVGTAARARHQARAVFQPAAQAPRARFGVATMMKG
ncbi:MAG: O-antigen ligase family protein [Acidocella sp.]